MTWNTSDTANGVKHPSRARERPVFIYIRPEGFILNGVFRETIDFVVINEFQARKLWDATTNKPVCFSSNGHKSHKGASCSLCPKFNSCQLKLRLLFRLEAINYCLELPKTSYENYRNYTTELLRKRLNVKQVTTFASVVDRGYWGEVCFEVCSLRSSQ